MIYASAWNLLHRLSVATMQIATTVTDRLSSFAVPLSESVCDSWLIWSVEYSTEYNLLLDLDLKLVASRYVYLINIRYSYLGDAQIDPDI